MLDKHNIMLRTEPLLEPYLPYPSGDVNVETGNGRWAVKRSVPMYMIMDERSLPEKSSLQWAWEDLYKSASIHVMKASMSVTDGWIVYKLYPVIRRGGQILDSYMEFILYMDLFIANTRDVVIPEFRYVDNRPVEWRCSGCATINPIEARYCGQVGQWTHGCGRPRAFLVQEWNSV